MFLFVAPCWAPRPFGGARAKKHNTTQGVFLLLRPRRKGAPRWAPARGQSKNKNTTPCRRPTGRSFPCLSPGPELKTHIGGVFFCFALAPPKGRGAQRGATKKKHFAHPGTTATKLLETNDTGHEQKGATKNKKTTHSKRPCTALTSFAGRLFRLVYFFLLRPRADAHSLTACLGRDASRRGVFCFFFFAAAPPGPGWCFFFFAVAPPGRSLTHCGLRRFRQGPGGFFCFLLRPRRTRRANNKKCLVYYIGSKKSRRGHSKKKTPLPP